MACFASISVMMCDCSVLNLSMLNHNLIISNDFQNDEYYQSFHKTAGIKDVVTSRHKQRAIE